MAGSVSSRAENTGLFAKSAAPVLATVAPPNPKDATMTADSIPARILANGERLGSQPAYHVKAGAGWQATSWAEYAAEMTTATPITEEMKQRARSALERVTGAKVRLTCNVKPDLIGGAVTKIGSTVYDGSLRSQLEQLRRKMAEG